MWRVTDDPPRPAGAEDALLVADPERYLSLDHEPALLVRVPVARHDGIRSQLDDRDRQPFTLDSTGDDAVPDLDRREVGQIGEVRHEALPDAAAATPRRGPQPR